MVLCLKQALIHQGALELTMHLYMALMLQVTRVDIASNSHLRLILGPMDTQEALFAQWQAGQQVETNMVPKLIQHKFTMGELIHSSTEQRTTIITSDSSSETMEESYHQVTQSPQKKQNALMGKI